MTENIKPCRFCGIHTEFYMQDICTVDYRAACKNCGARGPFVGSEEEAIKAWNEMMTPPAQESHSGIDTSYRDRVDRVVAACVMSSWTSDWQADQIVKYAMVVIDAIDKALAEQEGK